MNLMNMKSCQILFLILIVLVQATRKDNTQFWKKQLGGSIDFQAYSGFQQINWYHAPGASQMFYTLFGAVGHDLDSEDLNTPLIIWLQGGPGASSQFGAFTQIGPVRVKQSKVQRNHNSWNMQGHLLFIDNPLNTGFSYHGDRMGETQVSSTQIAGDHLLNFLFNFYRDWPKLRDSPLFITGESFGGHYVPCFARKILLNNTFKTGTGVKLQGIAIGDGWTDPTNQVNFYDSYLWTVGVVDNKFRDVLTWFQNHAILNMQQKNYKNATAFFDFITNNNTTPQTYFGNISMFNFRNYDGIDKSFATILNNSRSQFESKNDYFSGNKAIYAAFAADVSMSYAEDVITCLRDIRVLIYNGQNDVVVNTAGVLQYLNSLDWEGINAWKRSKKQIWTLSGQIKGWVKSFGNLWFALVNGAGHMVPSDKPQQASNLIAHFIRNHRDWKD